jgi:hypothetical protein
LIQIEAMDMGAPVSRLRNTKPALLKMVSFFASQATNITGETLMIGSSGNITTMTLEAAVGVIGGIIPWNGPLNSQFWIIGAVLASGCTAVLKPSEDASLSVLRVAEILHEAGMPAGVINVVTGLGKDAGHALANHPGVSVNERDKASSSSTYDPPPIGRNVDVETFMARSRRAVESAEGVVLNGTTVSRLDVAGNGVTGAQLLTLVTGDDHRRDSRIG